MKRLCNLDIIKKNRFFGGLYKYSFLIMFVCNLAIAATNNYAVADFKATNVSASDAAIVAELVRNALVNSGISVLDRANMEYILAEQGLQFSGCTDSDCAAQMGKILNVHTVIVGMLGKMGNVYLLTVNSINVESGKIQKSEKVKFKLIEDLDLEVEKLIESLISRQDLIEMVSKEEVEVGIENRIKQRQIDEKLEKKKQQQKIKDERKARIEKEKSEKKEMQKKLEEEMANKKESNKLNVVVVGDAFLGRGQSFFNGEKATNGGDFSLAFVPAISVNSRIAILPGYYGNYRGSKSVYELIGGGTLYQDSMDHNITLRLINRISPGHKFKLKAGYDWNYFRETKDESWGDGLFDFEKFTAGIENEIKNAAGFDKFILSFDILKVKFPQYASLASEKYGKEVFPGGNILDFNGLNVYFRGLRKMGQKAMLDVNINFLLKDFPDQNVIDSLGDYTLTKRKDSNSALNIVYSHLFGGFSAGLALSAGVNRSNQDHYDVAEYEFVDNYYDYNSYSAGPVVSFGGRLKFDIAYRYGMKNYDGRLVQKNTPLISATHGDYTNAKVENKTHFVSIGAAYKLTKNLKLKLSGNYFKQTSNQKYEAVYQYEYDTQNFEGGIVYEF